MFIPKKDKSIDDIHFTLINLRNDLDKYDVCPKYFPLYKQRQISHVINSLPKRCIAYLGSGDFHYLSYFLIKRLPKKPFLILFDNHFDMNKAPQGFITCGSWGRQCIEENLIRGVLVVGANKKYYSNDQQYPFLYYIENGNKTMNTQMIKKIKGLEFYISIDKDVLSEKYVKTNWDQGKMELDSLLNWLKMINKLGTALGIDICGESYSDPLYQFVHPEEKETHEKINDKIYKIFLN